MVFVIGESGIGKELIVCFVYLLSECYDGLFVVVNCGVFLEMLIESELFGYECGVFIGVINS